MGSGVAAPVEHEQREAALVAVHAGVLGDLVDEDHRVGDCRLGPHGVEQVLDARVAVLVPGDVTGADDDRAGL
jgi:hypothetical protein